MLGRECSEGVEMQKVGALQIATAVTQSRSNQVPGIERPETHGKDRAVRPQPLRGKPARRPPCELRSGTKRHKVQPIISFLSRPGSQTQNANTNGKHAGLIGHWQSDSSMGATTTPVFTRHCLGRSATGRYRGFSRSQTAVVGRE